MENMKRYTTLLLLIGLIALPIAVTAQKGRFGSIQQLQSPQNPRLGFIIHGGAGVIKKGSLTPEKEKEYKDKLEEAVLAGYKALQAGKSSLDAVEIAIGYSKIRRFSMRAKARFLRMTAKTSLMLRS